MDQRSPLIGIAPVDIADLVALLQRAAQAHLALVALALLALLARDQVRSDGRDGREGHVRAVGRHGHAGGGRAHAAVSRRQEVAAAVARLDDGRLGRRRLRRVGRHAAQRQLRRRRCGGTRRGVEPAWRRWEVLRADGRGRAGGCVAGAHGDVDGVAAVAGARRVRAVHRVGVQCAPALAALGVGARERVRAAQILVVEGAEGLGGVGGGWGGCGGGRRWGWRRTRVVETRRQRGAGFFVVTLSRILRDRAANAKVTDAAARLATSGAN